MPRRLFIFSEPDRFVAGTVGEPGDRTFFLQARKGSAVVSVSLEKLQVAALATRLGVLLEAVDAAPAVVRGKADEAALDKPLVEVFRVGAMALAWDAPSGAVLIEAQPISEDEDYHETADDDPDGPDLLRVRISAAAAVSFIARAMSVVAGGRSTCPFCGLPLEPNGHFCPRRNGHLN
jgi:conserved hypothetical protein